MNRSLAFTAMLMALTLTGCSTIAKYLNIQNPTYSLRNLQPRVAIALPLSASTIDLDFDLGVDNPNTVGVTLSGIDFDVLVNGNRLVSSRSNQGVRIPANGYGAVHLRSRVGYNDVRSIFQQVADVIQG